MSASEDIEEVPADEEITITFKELGLAPKILKALDDMGHEKPTPIQARSIPAAMEQRDVLGIAQTGTGKTGAFVLPTLHKLERGRARARMPRCLIICPTRELAAQVAENVEQYGKYLKLEMALLIGGVSFAEQDRKLSKGVDILIATPGRLLDQFERGKILMTGVQTLVVDEADRMLDMGFIPDVEKIFKMTPFTRQVLFFSATMASEIKRLVDQFLHQPVTVQIARQSSAAETVRQRIIRMPSSDSKQKRTALRWIMKQEDVDNGIIFCNRKRDVDIVAKSLTVHGESAAPIHGDLSQSLRTETLDKFKNGEIKYLVASDVAARGLDVPSVSHVFNYDVPNHSEDYVHRIGRTGRAGREGDTIMLVARLDENNYQDILNLLKVDGIEEIDVPGIEDFPKDGGRKKGRGRKGDRKGRRGDKGSNRKHNTSKDNNSDKSSKSSPPSEAPKEEKKAKPSRRKAPTKNNSDKTSEKEPTDLKAESNTKKKSSKSTPSKSPSKSSDKKTSDSSKGKSSNKGRDRNGLPHNKDTGFGGNMPDFFKV
ncbi:DEAD/DEAH box helicase [Litorimonas haliclonae]|uniref:DEAD/DEAH box helicase n=1 Tax=Litorimonas haliclonae TaxID=2081977 RepID=UPI0039EE6B24